MRKKNIKVVVIIFLCLIAVLLIGNFTDCATLRVGNKTADRAILCRTGLPRITRRLLSGFIPPVYASVRWNMSSQFPFDLIRNRKNAPPPFWRRGVYSWAQLLNKLEFSSIFALQVGLAQQQQSY